MPAEKYGDKYWGVGVNKSISFDGWLSTMADSVTVSSSGDLVFLNHGQDGKTWPGLIVARGQWTYCHAASCVDGGMITVDHIETPPTKADSSERGKMTQSLRYNIMSRDSFKCTLCGRNNAQDGVKLHVDHIIPISRGGKTEPSNLRTLCAECNHGKSDKVPNEDN